MFCRGFGEFVPHVCCTWFPAPGPTPGEEHCQDVVYCHPVGCSSRILLRPKHPLRSSHSLLFSFSLLLCFCGPLRICLSCFENKFSVIYLGERLVTVFYQVIYRNFKQHFSLKMLLNYTMSFLFVSLTHTPFIHQPSFFRSPTVY